MNLSSIQPPLAIAVKNPRFISKLADGEGSVWAVDIKACRHGVLCTTFEGIYFIESKGIALIYGIEAQDWRPASLSPAEAQKQRQFLEFLREQTQIDIRALGAAAFLFDGIEYAQEGKATAAYIDARGVPLHMGIGYRNHDRGYDLIAIDPQTNGWLESVRGTLPFDELGSGPSTWASTR